MKLLSLKCPGCGAKLEVNDSLKQFTCNYCGLTTMLDNEEIVVKNVTSKLQNIISELKDYYESGNYLKCYNLSKDIISEYPENNEIQFYINNKKCELAHALDEVDCLYEKYNNKKLVKTTQEVKKDIVLIDKYKNDFPDNETIDKTYNFLHEYKKNSQVKEIIAIVISIIVFILFLLLLFNSDI